MITCTGGADRLGNRPFLQLSDLHYLELGSGYAACYRVPIIDICGCTVIEMASLGRHSAVEHVQYLQRSSD